MFKEELVLPLITEIKAIFDLEIIDFLLLDKKGIRYAHAEYLIENTFLIFDQANTLKKEKKPYILFDLENYKGAIFYNQTDAFLAIVFESNGLSEKTLDIIYNRLLNVSFFKHHFELNLDKLHQDHYAMVTFDYEGYVKNYNHFAAESFKIVPSTLSDFNNVFEDFESFKVFFNTAKNNPQNLSITLETKFNQTFKATSLNNSKANLIQVVFTFTPKQSFYENILDSFDFLKLGIVHLSLIFDDSNQPVDASIIYANAQYGRLMNSDIKEVIGKTIYSIFPDFPEKRFTRYANVALKRMHLSYEDYVPSLDKHFHIYSYSPKENEFINVYYETTYFHKLQSKEREQLRKLQMMMSFAEMGFFEVDIISKKFKSDNYVKKIFENQLTDYDAYRELFIHSVHEEDKNAIFSKNKQLLNGDIKEGVSLVRMNLPNAKRTKYIEYYLQTLDFDHDGKAKRILGLVRDVTDTQEVRNRIDYLASHDQLTDVFNRHHLKQSLRKEIFHYPIELAILDLDGLKTVNDVFGHYQGDQVIKTFAKRLREIYHDQYIARIGGDEFVIIFTRACKNKALRETQVREKIANLLDLKIPLDVSIGYATLNENDTFSQVLNKADEAMYRDKLLARPMRKQRILKAIMSYLFHEDKTLLDRIDRLKNDAIDLMHVLGYERKNDLNNLKDAIYYHAIGQVMDYVQKVKIRKLTPRHEFLNVEAGFKILSNLIDNEVVTKTVLYQCEYYNGKGYPHHLKGTDIPLHARILSLVYGYEYLFHDLNLSKEAALKRLESGTNKFYDPIMMDAYLSLKK
ncbi:MAG: diguanylate cyclase [Candidatus Izemoplasmataceae bacterium]